MESHWEEGEETKVYVHLAMLGLLMQKNDILTDNMTILAQINDNLVVIADALQSVTKKNKKWTNGNDRPKLLTLKFVSQQPC